jgi:hypothetical protein
MWQNCKNPFTKIGRAMITKTMIVFVLILIIASLGLALRYLFKDGGGSPRTVKALTYRIGMSLALFFLLLLGYQAGILHPHGLNTGVIKAQSGAELK